MARKSIITDAISEQIKDLYLNGKQSALQISKALKISSPTITTHIKKMGWDNVELMLTDDEKERILSHINQGHSIYTIRDVEGISINKIKSYLDGLDIDIEINKREKDNEPGISGKEFKEQISLEEQLTEYFLDDEFVLNYISSHDIGSIKSNAIELYNNIENVDVKLGKHKDSKIQPITKKDVSKTHTLTKIKTYLEYVKGKINDDLCKKMSDVIERNVSQWREDYMKRNAIENQEGVWEITDASVFKLPTIKFNGTKQGEKWVRNRGIDLFRINEYGADTKEFDELVRRINDGCDDDELNNLLYKTDGIGWEKTTANYMWAVAKSDIVALCEIWDFYERSAIVDEVELDLCEWEKMIFDCNKRIETKMMDLGDGPKTYIMYGRQSINKIKRYKIDMVTAQSFGLKPNTIYWEMDKIKEALKVDDDELELLIVAGKIYEVDSQNRKIRN